MKLIRNYFFAQWIGPIILSITVFTMIMLIGNLVKFIDSIVNKGVPLHDVVLLFCYTMPYLLCYTIPMGVLTGTLLAFGRLSSDNEIIALRATGVSLYRLLMPLIAFGLLISAASLMINDSLVPWTHYQSRQIAKNIGLKAPTAYLEAGTFIKAFKNYILFIYEIDGSVLKGVTIYEPRENGPTRTIVAQQGSLTANEETQQVRLELINGTSDEPHPNDPTIFYKLNFKNYLLTLDLSSGFQKNHVEKKPMDMSLKELATQMHQLRQSGIPPVPLQIEFHRKFSLALASTIFIIIGFPLAVMTRRKEKIFGFGISMAIIVLYYILLASGKALSLKGVIHPASGMWIPNAIIFFLGAGLLIHANRH